MRPTPTAPVAAGTLIVGYAVAVLSGSRPLGGVVLLIGGLWCIHAWRRRHGPRIAAILATVAFLAFATSHVLALAIGAWPSVLVVAGVVGAVAWTAADARAGAAEDAKASSRGSTFTRRAPLATTVTPLPSASEESR